MSDLFDTPEKIDNGAALFRSLLDNGGWQLFVQIANENIEEVKNQILYNPEKLDEKGMDRLRDKLAVMEQMRDTPQNMIKKLTTETQKEPESDPFDTVATLTARSGDEELSKKA